MVTVTPHLRHAIGVLVVSEKAEKGLFRPLAEAETAVPLRRAGEFAVPHGGGDVMIKICEGVSEIKITKPPPRQKAVNGRKSNDDDDDDEEGEDDDSEDEPEDLRERVWKVGNVLAETSIRGTTKGRKVEVSVTVNADLSAVVTAREVGGKAGAVRGTLERVRAVENGSAS